MQSPQLDPNTLEAMQRQLNQPVRRGRQRWATFISMAAAMLLIVGVWTTAPDRVSNPEFAVSQRLVEEVTTNHLHLRQMDVLTGDFSQLQNAMGKLNFAPLMPTSSQSLTLQGARYCTLLGALATQILFETDQGETVTVFQAAYEPGRFGPLAPHHNHEHALDVDHHGVQVRVWVEQDVVMAIARNQG